MNAERHIRDAIESVLGQTYRNFELIVIDGSSSDGTVSIIKEYGPKLAYWVSEPDTGIYDAWNKLIPVARGEWISFLGADDILKHDALERYVDVISRYSGKGIDFISSKVFITRSDLTILRSWGEAWTWPAFQREMRIAHVGALHHRRLFEKFGLFDTSYRICGDYEFLLRAKADLRAAFLDDHTASLRGGGASTRVLSATGEAARAKNTTGERPWLLSQFERGMQIVRAVIRNLVPLSWIPF